MRAAVIQGPELPLAVETVDDPGPSPNGVVLRVEACGICGSDLHLSQSFPIPGLLMGHEFCGSVVAVGHDVHDLREGDRVSALPLDTCGRCVACLSGNPRKCLDAKMIGIELPGGYAEYVAVPARSAFRLPDALDERHGALVEPLAVALHAIDRARVQPGDDVLVLGAGPVGLAVAVWLQALGAREVVVSDFAEGRRALAERLGATATIDPSAGDVGQAFADIAGRHAPVVIECVGVPGLINQAADAVAVDGRLCIAGVCMTPDEIVPLTLMGKELDVHFAFYYRERDFDMTIDMLERRRIDPLPMVTDEIDLDSVPERFEALRHPTDQAKILIRP